MSVGKYLNPSSLVLLILVGMKMVAMVESHDYGDALSKCLLFFEGQRSGKLPNNQRMTWRKDSALYDGSDIGMNLVGGYYDAGDNIKFNFPMAFTTTTLAWSILEFGDLMGSQKQYALEALKWGTDYFLKATSIPGKVVASVGDPVEDHDCWERPEDMDTPRTSYVVNTTHPGSEVSAEIAAALAASSIVFRSIDGPYSHILLRRAYKVFQFADQYRGSYNSSVAAGVCPFYCDVGGYEDELVWAAAWLYKATGDQKSWKYVKENSHILDDSEFGWDSKQAGINVLMAGTAMKGLASDPFVSYAEKFVCSVLPESPTKIVSYSKGGILIKARGSNTQCVTALSFLLVVYSRYLATVNGVVRCGNVVATPPRLVQVAKSQVDYLLGDNPMGLSYMVGYGSKFPRYIHHRGSTLPNMHDDPRHIRCSYGYKFFQMKYPNFNVLTGAIVGGPDINDYYNDTRLMAEHSEPTTYINSPFVGLLSYFKARQSYRVNGTFQTN